MRISAFALCAALVLPAAASTGCTEEAKARFEADVSKRKREMQRKQLEERALEFWTAVRWQNWDEASLYLEESENQLLYLRDKTRDDVEFPTMDDVQIDYIFVDGETYKKAEMRASWTEFKPPARMAAKKQISQRWYKHNGFWWVAPEEVLPALDVKAASEPTADTSAPEE
jgi:hypothetical protein